MEPGRERRKAQLDGECDSPHRVAGGSVDRERGQPDRDAEGVAAAVEPDQRPGSRDGAPGAPVEDEHDRAEDRVGDGEPGAVDATRDVVDQDRHRGHGQHRGEVGAPEPEVVRVEARRVRHVALPGDVDRHEEPCEAEEPGGRVVQHEHMGELRDRDDEDEVEEELEPRGMAVARGLLRREQPRRDEPRLAGTASRRCGRLSGANAHRLPGVSRRVKRLPERDRSHRFCSTPVVPMLLLHCPYGRHGVVL